MEKKFKRTTVTSALPYANGPVHIGHLAGVYVPADIYLLKNSEFLSMFTPVLHQRHITNWLPSFSKRCMTKENSSKRHLNNIMMKRLTSFWPTDISQVNVPIVTQKVHTVTNAKSVVLHYHLPI